MKSRRERHVSCSCAAVRWWGLRPLHPKQSALDRAKEGKGLARMEMLAWANGQYRLHRAKQSVRKRGERGCYQNGTALKAGSMLNRRWAHGGMFDHSRVHCLHVCSLIDCLRHAGRVACPPHLSYHTQLAHHVTPPTHIPVQVYASLTYDAGTRHAPHTEVHNYKFRIHADLARNEAGPFREARSSRIVGESSGTTSCSS
jgi:hypothetical protein